MVLFFPYYLLISAVGDIPAASLSGRADPDTCLRIVGDSACLRKHDYHVSEAQLLARCAVDMPLAVILVSQITLVCGRIYIVHGLRA